MKTKNKKIISGVLGTLGFATCIAGIFQMDLGSLEEKIESGEITIEPGGLNTEFILPVFMYVGGMCLGLGSVAYLSELKDNEGGYRR